MQLAQDRRGWRKIVKPNRKGEKGKGKGAKGGQEGGNKGKGFPGPAGGGQQEENRAAEGDEPGDDNEEETRELCTQTLLATQTANAQTEEDGLAGKLATANAEADDKNTERKKNKELGVETLVGN